MGKKVGTRRIILINRRFQYSLIFKFLLVNALILIIFGGLFFLFLNSEIQSNLRSAHVAYHNMRDMLLPIVLTLSLLNILISSFIISSFVLIASHRIAGPLYRFNEAIKEIVNGNLKPLLKLRKKDELYAFSESLQEMADKMIEDSRRLGKIISETAKIVQEIENEELKEKIEQLNTYVNQYQL